MTVVRTARQIGVLVALSVVAVAQSVLVDLHPGFDPTRGATTLHSMRATTRGLCLAMSTSALDSRVFWSDGTASGTVLLPIVGALESVRNVHERADAVLVAMDRSLWRTDGLPANTIRLWHGAEHGRQLVTAAGLTWFVGRDTVGGPHRIWFTDRTVAGTQAVAECPGTGTWLANGRWAWLVSGGYSLRLCDSLTRAVTVVQQFQCITEIKPLGTRVLLMADAFGGGVEPWVSDGTAAGTVRLAAAITGGCTGGTSGFHDGDDVTVPESADGLRRTRGVPGERWSARRGAVDRGSGANWRAHVGGCSGRGVGQCANVVLSPRRPGAFRRQ